MKGSRQFIKASSGNVALLFALAVVPIFVGAGAAVDYSRAANSRTSLQRLTDAAALAGAASSDTSEAARIAAAKAFFPDEDSPTYSGFGSRPVAEISVLEDSVKVTATTGMNASLLGVVGIRTIPIRAVATGVPRKDGPPVCLLALNKTVSGAISFGGSTTFKAPNCGVYSNSKSPTGLTIGGSADVTAMGFCSAGGFSDTTGVKPTPQANCPPIQDPFASLTAPSMLIEPWKTCAASNDVGPNQTKTLSPGLYCGGLDIKGTANLNPGLYIIKDGQLKISAQASVTLTAGSTGGVTFYLTGTNAGFDINGGGTINIYAQDATCTSSGCNLQYKGLAIVQDRLSNVGATNTLNGDSNTVLKGAVYTPTQSVKVTGNGSFGEANAFMPIYADTISFSGSSTVQASPAAVPTVAPLATFAMGARLQL